MGDRPMPFPISKAMEQEEPIDKRSAKEEHKEDPIAPRSEPQQNTIPPLATLSPKICCRRRREVVRRVPQLTAGCSEA